MYPCTRSIWPYSDHDITRQSQVLLGDTTRDVGDEVWGVSAGGVAVVIITDIAAIGVLVAVLKPTRYIAARGDISVQR